MLNQNYKENLINSINIFVKALIVQAVVVLIAFKPLLVNIVVVLMKN